MKKGLIALLIVSGTLFSYGEGSASQISEASGTQVANPPSQTTAYEDYAKAAKLVQGKNYPEALTYINLAVQKEPKNSEYVAFKGLILRLNNSHDEALASMQAAISMNPDVSWYYVEAVVSAQVLQDIALARQYAEKAKSFGIEALGEGNYTYVSNMADSLKTTKYTLTFKFDPKKTNLLYETDGSVCFPVPSSSLPYQSSTYTLSGATLVSSDQTRGFDLICVKPAGTQEVSIVAAVTKTPYSYRDSMKKEDPMAATPADIQVYLQATDRLTINSSLVRKTAAPLKGNTDQETMKNIVNWVLQNMKYGAPPATWKTVDELILGKVVECGTGSLTAVALARANGIPARQVWGVGDFGRSYSPENYLKGHVWLEFYVRGAGWIPVDEFDRSSLGLLPSHYTRMMTWDTDLYNNIPLANMMMMMKDPTWGDIVAFTKQTAN